MSKRIPIKSVQSLAEQLNCRQAILLAWDGELTHVVTYGRTREDCSQAADGGNMLKEKWGWPECNDQPSRVKQLQTEIHKLNRQIFELTQQQLEPRVMIQAPVLPGDEPLA